MSPSDLVMRLRKANARLRDLSYRGGRNASTEYARRRHQSAKDHCESALLNAGHRDLVGLLTEEDGLVWRLRGLKAGERPELRARLKTVRAAIMNEVSP